MGFQAYFDLKMHDAHFGAKTFEKLLILNSIWLQNLCTGGPVPHILKMTLPNVNRKANYHIYIQKSTKVSAP